MSNRPEAFERTQFAVPDGEGQSYVVTIEHPRPFVFCGLAAIFFTDENYKVMATVRVASGLTPSDMAGMLHGTADTLATYPGGDS